MGSRGPYGAVPADRRARAVSLFVADARLARPRNGVDCLSHFSLSHQYLSLLDGGNSLAVHYRPAAPGRIRYDAGSTRNWSFDRNFANDCHRARRTIQPRKPSALRLWLRVLFNEPRFALCTAIKRFVSLGEEGYRCNGRTIRGLQLVWSGVAARFVTRPAGASQLAETKSEAARRTSLCFHEAYGVCGFQSCLCRP